MDTNNDLLHDIAGVDRNVYKTNNQLLKIIADAMSGGGEDAGTLNGQPGSYYLNRLNHTGTQAISTVSGLQAILDAKFTIPAGFSAGTVLGKNFGGDDSPVPYSQDTTGFNLVMRDIEGQIPGVTPTADAHLVNKQYVDGVISNKADKDNTWSPTDYNFVAWTFDIINAANSAALESGEMFVTRLKIQSSQDINRAHFIVSQSGSGLANAYAAIYQDGNLLGQSANAATAFQSTGGKTLTFSSPISVNAGYIDVGLWITGTSMPSIGRAGQLSGTADFLTGDDSRYATANTGLTTTAPSTLGTKTVSALSVWGAVSLA